MAFSARHVSPHDALSTDRYRPNPLARSLRAAADSKAHLPPFSPRSWMRYPLFSCASWKRNRKRGECRLCATPDRTVRSSCFSLNITTPCPCPCAKRIVRSFQVTAKKSTAVGADDRVATSKWFMSVFRAHGDVEIARIPSRNFTYTIACGIKKGGGGSV